MPRHPRIHTSEIIYHIIARGNNKQNIFTNDKDYSCFLYLLDRAKVKYFFKLYAYVLMPNHFHLLLRISNVTTSKIMQSILTSYAKYFNKTHKRIGHLFQGRYKAIICDENVYLNELIRYIHLNPVRAGFVSRPGEWVWNGHCEIIGKSDKKILNRDLVFEIFGKGDKAYANYKTFLEDGIGRKYIEEFHPKENSPFLGDDKFILRLKKNSNKEKDREKQSLDNILEKVSKRVGVKTSLVMQKVRLRNIAKARAEFVKKAILENGYKQADVSRYLNCDQSYVSRIITKISHISQV